MYKKLHLSFTIEYFLLVYLAQDKVIEVLIESGANVNAYGDSKRTPLYFAAKKGNSHEILKQNSINNPNQS